MKLCVPTNWDNELPERLKRIKGHNSEISELYGALPFGIAPAGRSPFSLPQVSRREAEKHIGIVKSAGLEFKYLLNAPTLMNKEYTKKGREEIREYLSWINSAGADSITLTIPYLVEYVKKEFPSLKVNISSQAGVNTARSAKYYEDLGADKIILRTDFNRNFETLKEIREAVKIELGLFANIDCIYQCPLTEYHVSLPTHSCRDSKGGYTKYVDYPKLACGLMKLTDLSNFFKSGWIRPEDIGEYESLGYDSFKLVDRRWPTEKILRVAEIYSKRRYDGNLVDLFFYIPQINVFCEQLKSQLPDIYKNMDCDELSGIEPPEISINNRELDGFMKFFRQHDCGIGCGKCSYCDELAKKHIKIKDKTKFDSSVRALQSIRQALLKF